jgi:hypothetical protein
VELFLTLDKPGQHGCFGFFFARGRCTARQSQRPAEMAARWENLKHRKNGARGRI